MNTTFASATTNSVSLICQVYDWDQDCLDWTYNRRGEPACRLWGDPYYDWFDVGGEATFSTTGSYTFNCGCNLQ
jgi:hypothetical protein